MRWALSFRRLLPFPVFLFCLLLAKSRRDLPAAASVACCHPSLYQYSFQSSISCLGHGNKHNNRKVTKALQQPAVTWLPGPVTCTCRLNTWEPEAETLSQVQGQPRLHEEVHTSLTWLQSVTASSKKKKMKPGESIGIDETLHKFWGLSAFISAE